MMSAPELENQILRTTGLHLIVPISKNVLQNSSIYHLASPTVITENQYHASLVHVAKSC